jgi:hypothetical protein
MKRKDLEFWGMNVDVWWMDEWMYWVLVRFIFFCFLIGDSSTTTTT